MTTPRKRAKPAPDPLANVKVEIHAGLGDSAIKAECPLGVAAEMLARFHQELERMGKLRPSALPTVEARGEQPLYVPDEDDYGCRRRRLGFPG
jgi:hypothetical protein